MAGITALLQMAEPGGLTSRWNFPDAIGSPAAAPGGIGDPVSVDYSFMQTLPAYDQPAEHPGFIAFDAPLQAAAAETLAAWSAVCGIDFVAVADAGEGGAIRFGRSDMAFGGFTWLPHFVYAVDAEGRIAAAESSARGGDVWLSTDASIDGQAAGGYGRYALAHEIGHAIGLKHPFEGADVLPAAEATLAHSVMAYAVPVNAGLVSVAGTPDAYRWTVSSLYPSGPMVEDIAAAQYLYGPNLATNAGDTQYAWPTSARFLLTLWDAGGTDTIDAGNQALPCVIDLNEGHSSSIGIRATEAARRAELPDWAVAAPTPSYDGRDNLWIAWGVTIEDAAGGAGADLLIGNAADNGLTGGAGNDTMIGGAGWDTLAGGAGNDMLAGGAGWDTLIGAAGWDTAVLPGMRAETLLRSGADGRWCAFGPGGADLLQDIEAVLFDDGAVAIAPAGWVA